MQIDLPEHPKNFNVKNYFNEDTFVTDITSLLWELCWIYKVSFDVKISCCSKTLAITCSKFTAKLTITIKWYFVHSGKMAESYKRIHSNCQGRHKYRQLIGGSSGIRSFDVITNLRSLVTRTHYAYERQTSVIALLLMKNA